jgi:hypothetical protein
VVDVVVRGLVGVAEGCGGARHFDPGERGTADPSTSLGMTKGRVVTFVESGFDGGMGSLKCGSLDFARDDVAGLEID